MSNSSTKKKTEKPRRCKVCGKMRKKFVTLNNCYRCTYKTQAKWKKNNRRRIAKNQRQWRVRHFFKHRASHIRPITAEQLASIWKAQRGCCALTGDPLTRDNASIDHIIPRSLGGDESLDNIQWVTQEANVSKGSMTMERYLVVCRKVVENSADETNLD